jgi:Peptidase family M28
VREQPFGFQPGALNALPILGAGLGWLTLLSLPLLLWPAVPRLAALVVWLIGAAALAAFGWGVGIGVPVPGAERREEANLIAVRPQANVTRWIVAHLDTKAQGHSLAGRLVAVWLLICAGLGLTTLALWRATSGAALPVFPVAAVAAVSLAAGALSGRGRLKGLSPGARDNGSGVLAALEAASLVTDPATGFVFTGAEEFGLVGARIFCRGGGSLGDAEVLNLDTLCDAGALYLLAHDRRGRALGASLAPVLGGIAPRTVVRRLPLGILVDSLPFARAGARAITISRLARRDLRVIHTPADAADGEPFHTPIQVARAIAQLYSPH